MVKTKCCNCAKPGSIPAVVKKPFNVRHLLINSTRDEKELSRIKKELKQV